jgi:hypothetical protein
MPVVLRPFYPLTGGGFGKTLCHEREPGDQRITTCFSDRSGILDVEGPQGDRTVSQGWVWGDQPELVCHGTMLAYP